MEAERPSCPADRCQGHLETVISTCRPGEVDVSIRCDGCGRVKHVVLDANGRPLDDAALRAHRTADAPTKTAAEPPPEPHAEP